MLGGDLFDLMSPGWPLQTWASSNESQRATLIAGSPLTSSVRFLNKNYFKRHSPSRPIMFKWISSSSVPVATAESCCRVPGCRSRPGWHGNQRDSRSGADQSGLPTSAAKDQEFDRRHWRQSRARQLCCAACGTWVGTDYGDSPVGDDRKICQNRPKYGRGGWSSCGGIGERGGFGDSQHQLCRRS